MSGVPRDDKEARDDTEKLGMVAWDDIAVSSSRRCTNHIRAAAPAHKEACSHRRKEDTMAEMTKRERVMAALRGDAVDRPPFSFWAHNFAKENSARDLADETARLAREFDFDFLKPQSRAQCFEEAWGVVYRASGERTTKPTP